MVGNRFSKNDNNRNYRKTNFNFNSTEKRNTIILFIGIFLTTRHNIRFWGHRGQRFNLDHFLDRKIKQIVKSDLTKNSEIYPETEAHLVCWGWWWRTFFQRRCGKRRKATAAIWWICKKQTKYHWHHTSFSQNFFNLKKVNL